VFAETFVPGNITGFFALHSAEDIFDTGTTGAGVCISQGVRTRMEAHSSSETSCAFYTNGKRVDIAGAAKVCENLLSAPYEPYEVTFHYDTSLPIGSGYGVSGATALGTARCLGRLLHCPQELCGAIAHRAEIETFGGHGDVVSQLSGGVCLRESPGINGIIGQIPKQDHKVLSLSFGPLSTKKVLSDSKLVETINCNGLACMQDITHKKSLEGMMELSRSFSIAIGLETPRLKEAISALDKAHTMPSSMVMLGETLFTFAKDEELPPLLDVLLSFDGEVFVSGIWEKI